MASGGQFLPPRRDLRSLRQAAAQCEGCPLFANATQTVFGEGPARAQLVFVGEQPGDQENKVGRPFVGPAGQHFDKILAELGIARQQVYVTNAVKHFKWTPQGKRRLHGKPSSREVVACRPWLEAELAAIEPQLLVLLGATAAQSLLGLQFRITKERGPPRTTEWAPWTLATYRPAAVLRGLAYPGGAARADEFIDDLRLVAEKLRQVK
jgi:DNA polymerase